MIKISSISVQEKDKCRCNIFVNEEFFCALYLENVLKYNLKKDCEVTEEKFNGIKAEDEVQFALKRSKNYISKSLKTKMQVITYLKDKGFSGKVIYEVIEKMIEYGYVDDVEFARSYLECNTNQGKRLADYKLMQKGVKKEDIERARENLVDNSNDIAKKLAEKRLKNKEITKELIQKTYKYLIGKGFSFEEAENAVSKYMKEIGE